VELQATDIYPDMDPRLQVAADRYDRGLSLLATTPISSGSSAS